MTTVTILPFDLTGRLATNKRSGELHTLTRAQGKTNRMFTPKFGAYYKDSLDVRTGNGVPLVYDKDYVCTYYYQEIWELNAKAACAIIVVTNPAIGNDIRISYQAVGGPYALSLDELKDILTEVENSPTPLKWEDILNKPLQFPPGPHTHEYWQLYGLESTCVNLDLLGDAWAAGRKGVLADNRFFYRNYIDLAQKAVDDYTVKVMAHINDKNNPHLTDKTKVGLSQINNWGMATTTESASKTVNNKYQPMGGIYDQLQAHVTPVFDTHVRNVNNPHQVKLTDALLNLYSTAQIQALIDVKLKRTEVAYDTTLFNGLTQAQLYTNLRTNLSATNVNPATRFVQTQMGPAVAGWNPADYALAGNNTYVPYSTLMKTYNDTQGSVYFIGAQPTSAFNYLSVGTYAIQGIYQSVNSWRQTMKLYIYVRTATGWNLVL